MSGNLYYPLIPSLFIFLTSSWILLYTRKPYREVINYLPTNYLEFVNILLSSSNLYFLLYALASNNWPVVNFILVASRLCHVLPLLAFVIRMCFLTTAKDQKNTANEQFKSRSTSVLWVLIFGQYSLQQNIVRLQYLLLIIASVLELSFIRYLPFARTMTTKHCLGYPRIGVACAFLSFIFTGASLQIVGAVLLLLTSSTAVWYIYLAISIGYLIQSIYNFAWVYVSYSTFMSLDEDSVHNSERSHESVASEMSPIRKTSSATLSIDYTVGHTFPSIISYAKNKIGSTQSETNKSVPNSIHISKPTKNIIQTNDIESNHKDIKVQSKVDVDVISQVALATENLLDARKAERFVSKRSREDFLIADLTKTNGKSNQSNVDDDWIIDSKVLNRLRSTALTASVTNQHGGNLFDHKIRTKHFYIKKEFINEITTIIPFQINYEIK